MMEKPNTLVRIQKAIINDFCDKEIADEVVVNPKMLQKFAQLYHEEDKSEDALQCEDTKLQGRFFLGLNVKTDSEEGLKPIPFFWPQGYDPKLAEIAEGGSISDMFELKNILDDYRPEQDNRFKWNPNNWKPEMETNVDAIVGGIDNSAVDMECTNEVIQTIFSSPYGLDYVQGQDDYDAKTNPKGNKYNILGEIYFNALQLKGDCHVLIHFFDYDLTNGKNLSFVLAVCELEDDMKTITDKLDDLINFIMLVKARYVRKIQHQRQVESMKSAVAAIMSRNMSHNLGSHYLYYTKNQLSKLAEKHNEIGPEIRGAAKVLGYMQARMDYLATIVSEDKYPYGSVYFKGQIFDELTVDDFSTRHFPHSVSDHTREQRRTVNYLLQNLILSENFTREPVYDGQDSLLTDPNDPTKPNGNKTIRIQVKTRFGMFNRAIGDVKTKRDEDDKIKLDFSKICIALPGGIMSIHAFFNVLENFIRNSAKYLKEDFKEEGLIFTIVINELEADKNKELPERYEFVIYDNKNNANKLVSNNDNPDAPKKKLVEWMNEQLGSLKFLTENNELDKHSKGLKEMLFSTLWMRAYSWLPAYANYSWKRMADKLVEFDEMSGNEKLLAIIDHAFGFVAVDEQDVVYQYKYKEREGWSYFAKNDRRFQRDGNLGIRFELPKYRMLENIEAEELKSNLKEIGLYNYRDIICLYSEQGGQKTEGKQEREPVFKGLSSIVKGIVAGLKGEASKEEYETTQDNEALEALAGDLRSKFTRVYLGKARKIDTDQEPKEAVEIFRKVLLRRFPDFDKYHLGMDDITEAGFDANIGDGIYFRKHVVDLEDMTPYAYCESISGENFTETMRNIFKSGFDDSEKVYKDKSTEYFALKIKEAALTRITLIDERFYKDMVATPRKSEYLRLKNIRVINLKNTVETPKSFMDMFEGNCFTDGTNHTHFLSIHLGMIDKIVKDKSPWIKMKQLENAPMKKRVDELLQSIKDTFKMPDGELFISIHSGRGNFSPELDMSLKGYPFISISAIESVYANSKFLLAQLFYNTVYIGKGEINEQPKQKP